MIVDVHSHFSYADHFTADFARQSRRAHNCLELDLTVRWDEYEASSADRRGTLVFEGKARLSGIWFPDAEVAAYAAQHPDRLISFLSVDPIQIGWRDELIEGHQNLK